VAAINTACCVTHTEFMHLEDIGKTSTEAHEGACVCRVLIAMHTQGATGHRPSYSHGPPPPGPVVLMLSAEAFCL
jgi:hypothetical protein